MSNKDEFKNIINQIHAPEDLKQKTLEKMIENEKEHKNNNEILFKTLSAVAACVLVFFIGFNYFYLDKKGNIINIAKTNDIPKTTNTVVKKEIEVNDKNIDELPRFKDKEELIALLEKNDSELGRVNYGMAFTDAAVEESVETNSAVKNSDAEVTRGDTSDYSKTNTQVENVDEADIVKTDGNYIYYITNNKLFVINSKNLEIESKLSFENEYNNSFSIYEMFINNNKLVLFGNYTEFNHLNNDEYNNEKDYYYDYYSTSYKTFARAIVYDISNKSDLKQDRVIDLDGSYKNSRMIGDSIYFISNKYPTYYLYKNSTDKNEKDILPVVCDSFASTEEIVIDAKNIAYFPNSRDYSYTLIGGFNLNDNEPLKVETYFGASNTIYCSENNLYIAQNEYNSSYTVNGLKIYKFKLDQGEVELKATGSVQGSILNQYSMDEYEGNLRIATTVYNYRNGFFDNDEERTDNRLYILDEDLNEIGKITDLAKGERIYAVRFIGKTGYVVTFEQVDPLFVIDLSNPTNPEVKGELKIPGYSSYLHPYDENHIIGIGYNVESNGYGGVRNTNIKMSMFDISDLENPKEMFNKTIGYDYAYSNIFNNPKALFYKKSDDLIGFQYYTYIDNDDYYSYEYKYIFEIFHIDLEKGFETYGKFNQGNDYFDEINRMIYIGDTLFGMSYSEITAFDMNSLEKIKTLKLGVEDFNELLY